METVSSYILENILLDLSVREKLHVCVCVKL